MLFYDFVGRASVSIKLCNFVQPHRRRTCEDSCGASGLSACPMESEAAPAALSALILTVRTRCVNKKQCTKRADSRAGGRVGRENG